MRWGAVWLGVVLMAGCTAREEPEGPSGPLAPTLQVGVERDSVRLDLHVTNLSTAPLVLSFSSGQRFDFVVRSEPDGQEVWRWSADRVFTQVLGEDTLAPGETVRHRAVWPSGGRRGRFTATGRIPARGHGVELSREFELP